MQAIMQPYHQSLNDDDDYTEEAAELESEQRKQKQKQKQQQKTLLYSQVSFEDWNPFGDDCQPEEAEAEAGEEQDDVEGDEEDVEDLEEDITVEDELEPSWQDEQKNKVDAILSRRRRGEEMKDTSATSSIVSGCTNASASDMDGSGMGDSSAAVEARRRRRADRSLRRSESSDEGGATASSSRRRADHGLRRSESSDDGPRRLRREQRRRGGRRSLSRKRSQGPGQGQGQGQRHSRSSSTPRNGTGASRSPPARTLTNSAGGGRSNSSRNLGLGAMRRTGSHDGSSRNLALDQEQPRRHRDRQALLQKSRSQNRGLGADHSHGGGTAEIGGRRHVGRRSRSTRSLMGGSTTDSPSCTSAPNNRCTNTSPKQQNSGGSLPRTNSSPSLNSKIKPESNNPARPMMISMNPTECGKLATPTATHQSRRVKKTLSPKPTASRPTSRKASCVMLLRSSSTSRLQVPHVLGKENDCSTTMENFDPLF